MGLLDTHKTEISALNAIVQLLGGSSSITPTVEIETNDAPISSSNPLPVEVISDTGSITTGILSPALPYTIPDDIYNSFTIITSGTVSIDGVAVIAGSYTYSCNSNETLKGLDLTTSGGGTVVILTQQK